MNLDKTKILKAVVIIALICVGVSVLTQVSKQNSLTLQDYAEQYPEATTAENEADASDEGAVEDMEDSSAAAQGDDKTTAENVDGSNADANGNTEKDDVAGSGEGDTSTSENTKDAQAATFTSALTGAQLNGESVMELRTTYTDYFYYEPLSEKLRDYITGVSYPDISQNTSSKDAAIKVDTEEASSNMVLTASTPETSTQELAISYDDLRYLHIMHYNFDGELVEGELICNKGIAQDLVEIFYELYRNEYRIEKVLLIDEYNGDDTASMEDNNTSCFNYRLVENSTSLSKHALGLALDINPLYNPYITYNEDGSENVSPAAGVDYTDRSVSFPYKIDENDLCYKLFIEHGFIWGGNWNSCKDYQHFQKVLP